MRRSDVDYIHTSAVDPYVNDEDNLGRIGGKTDSDPQLGRESWHHRPAHAPGLSVIRKSDQEHSPDAASDSALRTLQTCSKSTPAEKDSVPQIAPRLLDNKLNR
jgi:hypothetical protein